jgi:hypothetical protein
MSESVICLAISLDPFDKGSIDINLETLRTARLFDPPTCRCLFASVTCQVPGRQRKRLRKHLMIAMERAILVIDPPWTIFERTEQRSFRYCQRDDWEYEPALKRHLTILQTPSILRTGAAHAVRAGREQ